MENTEIKALLSLLDDEDAEVLQHIEAKIISMGEVMIPFLESAWEQQANALVQKRMVDLIHALQLAAVHHRLAEWKETEMANLLRGLWAVATYQYPSLDYKKLKKDIDKIYYEAWLTHRPYASPFDQVKNLNQVMFDKFNFTRNTQNPHAPNNLMLNVVVESRKGSPILLCVVYMLVAQRLKMPIFGVNLPNLFVLTYKSEETQFYINAFNRGMIFTKTDIDDYIAKLQIPHSPTFYEPCTHLEVVLQALRLLTLAFEQAGEGDKVAEVREILKQLRHD